MLVRTPSQVSGSFEFPLPEGQSDGAGSGAASVGGSPAATSSGSADGGSPGSVSSAPSAPSVPSSVTSPSPDLASPGANTDDGTPSDAFDFSSLLGGQFENGDVTTPPVAPPVPIPPTPATPVPAPVATPAAPPAPVAPAATPVAAVATGQPPLSLAEPGRLAEAMASQEAAIVEEAARTMFALSPEEITGLEENAVAIIPRLLARTYVQAQRSMLMTLQRALPAMLGTHLGEKQKHDANESKFYERWKDSGIDKSKHAPLVTRLASMYRKMNPQATFDQMTEELGPAVVMAAKIIPPAPGAPRLGNGIARPQAQPFVPAGGGPGAMSSQPQGEFWDILDPNRTE